MTKFFKPLKKDAYSEFEKIFIKYDLIDQAKLIKKKRIDSLHK